MTPPGWHPALDGLVRELVAIPEVERVLLFGSRATGGHRQRSDIDLAVLCPDADARVWARIEELVEEAPTLLPIDLVRLDEADPELVARILREGIVLHERRS